MLGGLSGGDRLDASAIKNLPSTGATGAQGIQGLPGSSGETWNDTAVITANYQILDRDRVLADTTAGILNLTCPASGDFKIADIAATSTIIGFALHSAFLLPNTGQTVRGATSFECDLAGMTMQFKKINNNWVNVNG